MSIEKNGKKTRYVPLSVLVAMLITFVVITFILQNSQVIVLKALFWKTEIQLAYLLFATIAVGALITILYLAPYMNKKRIVRNELRKRIKTLESGEAN